MKKKCLECKMENPLGGYNKCQICGGNKLVIIPEE